MKRDSMLLALAAAAFFAVGARAQGQAPSTDKAKPAAQDREQRKAAWENGVKTDCAAEIAQGGVCAGKDFGAGLEKCLHQNRKSLSDGCNAAVHPRRAGPRGRRGGGNRDGAKTDGAKSDGAKTDAPAQAPAAKP